MASEVYREIQVFVGGDSINYRGIPLLSPTQVIFRQCIKQYYLKYIKALTYIADKKKTHKKYLIQTSP